MPSMEEIRVLDVKMVSKGSLIKIIDDTCSHMFSMGSIFRSAGISPNGNLMLVDVDNGGRIQNVINENDFVVIEEKKKKFIGEAYQELNLAYLDGVVLPIGHKESILEALIQESGNNRRILFDDWGFGEHFEKGRGIIFMFYGVPGTGKTMCAELMAKALNKDHLMLTTAEIQSSVPGQAERNIQDAFKQAKSKNLLIIIDECDALLYDRNSVGAIMAAEINCLLSEIERFDGVVVMTTNRNHKLDTALERRIALKLEFPKPNREIRKKIWRKLVPSKCPLAGDVSFDKLSEHVVCGGNIKNIIFASARRALYQNKKKVSMADFQMGIRRELKGKTAFDRKEKRVRNVDQADHIDDFAEVCGEKIKFNKLVKDDKEMARGTSKD